MSPATSWPAACGCTLTPPGTVRREAPARSPARAQPAPGSRDESCRVSWHAAAKDHMIPSPATVTAFAIGLSRRFLDDAGLTVARIGGESMTQVASPEVSCGVNDAAATLIAGGAETHWAGP